MNIGIYIYDDAEVLDFSGPFEVFSTAKRLADNDWQLSLIAENDRPVLARGGYSVNPHYSFADCPLLDLLVVVGGDHTRELEKAEVIAWLKNTATNTKRIASVCTGAFLLAKTGLLSDKNVTTHWQDQPELAAMFSDLNVIADTRWVTDGKFTSSGGISAGIDMSLALVAEFISYEHALLTAKQMEYQWQTL
ncbi:DJ-1/PfpI family protein [Pseudoalteromonas sp. OFAV1]|uniref:DJ-1/PfpI family protein n=1 Tax=Pseudoalteromonas sp. OFAV1 TaxID=2908892 RepID=UPI001F29E998|nr:DJ-1/PfpI family protein [Pseudoalteromonas sp. OFAV1]MCF2899172.1 DJ-1/PfpI family protein [Pseudoalteromonas sp. OFAV1]